MILERLIVIAFQSFANDVHLLTFSPSHSSPTILNRLQMFIFTDLACDTQSQFIFEWLLILYWLLSRTSLSINHQYYFYTLKWKKYYNSVNLPWPKGIYLLCRTEIKYEMKFPAYRISSSKYPLMAYPLWGAALIRGKCLFQS